MDNSTVAEFDYLQNHIRLFTFGPEEHISRLILTAGTFYELDLLKKAQEIYAPGTIIIDVGANIGNHTVFFAKVLGAKVYAFEPNQPAFSLLLENITANDLRSRVEARPVGIGAVASRGHAIPSEKGNMGQAKVIEDPRGAIEILPLDAVSIDGPVGLIKIDVEGGECAVLRGARRLLKAHRPDVFLEAANEELYKSALEIMLPLGYVPCGRYAWTPTYLFSHKDQTKRFKHILRLLEHSPATTL
jgi:FkbM family methyltransferase